MKMHHDMPRVTPVPDSTRDSVHVLHWVPGYLDSDGVGKWELQTLAVYNSGDHQVLGRLEGKPRDAGAAMLGAWAAQKLGFAVILEQAGNATIRSASLRPLSVHRSREPVWYVRRASCLTSSSSPQRDMPGEPQQVRGAYDALPGKTGRKRGTR